MNDTNIFNYVIPGMDYSRKDLLKFISLIRLPDFVTKKDFKWAIETATKKKKLDFSSVEFFSYDEGLCVQCLHLGPYDNEPETVKCMHEYIEENGYKLDINDKRYHHEIYLSDPRRCRAEKLKTVIILLYNPKTANTILKLIFPNQIILILVIISQEMTKYL